MCICVCVCVSSLYFPFLCVFPLGESEKVRSLSVSLSRVCVLIPGPNVKQTHTHRCSLSMKIPDQTSRPRVCYQLINRRSIRELRENSVELLDSDVSHQSFKVHFIPLTTRTFFCFCFCIFSLKTKTTFKHE